MTQWQYSKYKFLNVAESLLLVAAGISDEGYTNTSEIIDLKKNYDLWNEPKQLPTMLDTPLAGYLDESTPLLRGISNLKILK